MNMYDKHLEEALKDLSPQELEGVLDALVLVSDYYEPDRGLYLVPPYGELIADGSMKCFAKPRRDDRLLGSHILVSGKKAYGVIVVGEPVEVGTGEFDDLFGKQHCVARKDRLRWWPEKESLYLYPVEGFKAYREPLSVHVRPGVQTCMESVEFKGGPGSGHHGHSGRPGKRGGSTPGSEFNKADMPLQWQTAHHKEDARVDTNSLVGAVKQSISEDPDRAVHGHTATNAFFIVDDDTYSWNKYRDIPSSMKAKAIPAHSHGGSNWREYQRQAGKPEDFQPHNSEDIRLWLKGVKEGRMAAVSVLIMPDGRMEVLELLPSTNPDVFKMGSKRLEKLVEVTYDEVSSAREKDPSLTTVGMTREKLTAFADEYGLGYYPDLSWGGLPNLEDGKSNEFLTITVAKTDDQATKGFSNRESIPNDEGLLIPLKPTTGIWMKDTTIPLTVAFLDSDYKVLSLTDLEPLDETIHVGPDGSAWALEASPTWFTAASVEVGDIIKLPTEEQL